MYSRDNERPIDIELESLPTIMDDELIRLINRSKKMVKYEIVNFSPNRIAPDLGSSVLRLGEPWPYTKFSVPSSSFTPKKTNNFVKKNFHQSRNSRSSKSSRSSRSSRNSERQELAVDRFMSPFAYEEAVLGGVHSCLFVAGRGELNRFVMYMYLKNLGMWSTSQEIPIHALHKRSFVIYKEFIYFIGGEEVMPEMRLDTLYKYNLKTGGLVTCPSMRVPRCDASAVVWKNSIYVIGGLSRLNQAMTHVEAYDIYLNTWRLMHPLKFKRYGAGVTILHDTLYMIGGNTIHCECYNLEYTFAWIELPELPSFCKDFTMVATHNEGCIIALRRFRPDRVFLLDMIEHDWKMIRTNGVPPENIQDICKCFEELYVVDLYGRIFVLNLKYLTWDQAITCPKIFTCFHIGNINFDDLSTTPGNVERDFE